MSPPREDRECLECRPKLPCQGVDHHLVLHLYIPAALGNAQDEQRGQAAQPRGRQGAEVSNQLRLGWDGQRRRQGGGEAKRLHAVGKATGSQEKLVQDRERAVEGRRVVLILSAVFIMRFPSTELVRIQPGVGGTGTMGHTLYQTSGILLNPDRPTMKDRRSWGGITQWVWRGNQ